MPAKPAYKDLENRVKNLEKENKKYSRLLGNLDDVVFTLDSSATVTYISPNVERVYGYPPKEILGRNYGEMVGPDDIENLGKDFHRAMAGQELIKEHQFLAKNRGAVWVVTRTRPIYESGEIAGVQGTLTEITERKHAENALKESEGRARAQLDAILFPGGEIGKLGLGNIVDIQAIQEIMNAFHQLTHIGVGIVDNSGNVLVANGWQDICTKFHRMHPETKKNCVESDLRLSEGIAPGKFRAYRCKNNMWDIATPIVIGGHRVGNLFLGQFFYEDEVPDRAFFRDQARKYRFDESEYLKALDRVPRWSRETVDTVMRFYADLIGLISRLSYSNMKLGKALQDLERADVERGRMMSAIEQIGEIVVITDPEGTIQYVNPAFETITGYTRKEALGQNPRILKSGKHDKAFYQELWATLCSGETWQGRFSNRKKDGSLYTEEAVISPVCDGKGQVVNYVAVKRDVTEALDLEEQLYQAQKMESIGQLAGGVAHDLNNLLSPILGFSELLLEDTSLMANQRESMEEIIGAGKRAKAIVRQLLAFSRKQPLQFQPIQINDLLDNFKNLLRRTLREDIHIQARLAPSLPPIKGDIGQLEQVIMNLAVNAQDALPQGGALTIETALVELDQAYAMKKNGVKPGSYVKVAISDTGSGMDAVTLEHLFEPFFTTKAKGKGTGLGMSTAYGIVKQHGGNIWAYSELGLGTTIKLYLPVSDLQSVDQSVNSEKRQSEIKGSETVLLVEDDQQVRNLSLIALKLYGYEVLIAENGQEAIARFEAHKDKIRLLITDVIMPDMNGKELYERIAIARAGMKVIYMSGYTDDVIMRHGVIDEGVNFIEKPFSLKTLAAKVREVLDQ